MIVKEGYLLCCCNTDGCEYQAIPKCCGMTMEYLGDQNNKINGDSIITKLDY